MSTQNEFIFGEFNYSNQRKAVLVPAKYNGVVYKCIISHELIKDRFCCSSSSLSERCKINKDIIEEVAKKLIISKKVGDENEVLITTEIFRNYYARNL